MFTIPEINVSELAELLAENEVCVLLDIREPDEVAICALDGFVHIPFQQIPNHLDRIPTDKKVIVYCHHGQRSFFAVNYLVQNGFSNVINLRGGIHEWALQIDTQMNTY